MGIGILGLWCLECSYISFRLVSILSHRRNQHLSRKLPLARRLTESLIKDGFDPSMEATEMDELKIRIETEEYIYEEWIVNP